MSDNTENSLLSKELISALLNERRKDRRWSIIRMFVWILFILLVYFFIFAVTRPADPSAGASYISLVRLNGVIMPGSNFSAYKVIPRLDKAFADPHSRGVILQINSPGGSPVQATIIHDRIEFLKRKFHKKVVVVGQDALASGAYLVATAADKIYVHKDTLTGSIGVIMSGFGFTDAIKKLGITRRVFTAGTNKDRLDPFMPVSLKDRKKVTAVLDQVHKNFIQDVLLGRKGRLHGKPSELFSGDFWTGSHAVSLGIVDGTGDLWTIMKTQFGVAHYRDYSVRPSLIESILKGAETKLGIALENDHVALNEELHH
ncbi:MAG: peptidase U7 [Coxiella sp. (in: Bacteria)]|nr:MAG: peptidase U7 [Coxiella sp. (in: g-proteobacteria)]